VTFEMLDLGQDIGPLLLRSLQALHERGEGATQADGLGEPLDLARKALGLADETLAALLARVRLAPHGLTGPRLGGLALRGREGGPEIQHPAAHRGLRVDPGDMAPHLDAR
jgi:hypothetical protein